MLEAIGLVMLGASFGAAARFLITHFSFEASQHHGFPYGTLIVNVAGSLLVGYVLTWSADHAHDRWRLLAATGFCGGFTTFSAFAFETMAYMHTAQYVALLMNVVLNNVLSFAALVAGIRVHQAIR
jgi:CrcB protein